MASRAFSFAPIATCSIIARHSVRMSIASSIETKLTAKLQPLRLVVMNESYKHAGHAGNPSGAADAETHFNVEVVAQAFEGLQRVKRHRMVYEVLADELAGGVHALALKLQAPSEV
eukprot:TRINITY_DN2840_c0_g1_i1.p2 TRINITY_DN2840_c0_g1~~TRINITY_DN2840_c0_g1_i1.p2  ORF type:complete len:116 (+),score=11.69 TRINITY_DN2840_c0_g1_i1:58-405(+)